MKNPVSNQEVLQAGIDWLKANFNLLVQQSTSALVSASQDKMPTLLAQKVATDSLQSMILRLGGTILDEENLRKNLSFAVANKVAIEKVVQGTDQIQIVVENSIKTSALSVEVRQALLQKVDYIQRILKTKMIMVMIEFQNQEHKHNS